MDSTDTSLQYLSAYNADAGERETLDTKLETIRRKDDHFAIASNAFRYKNGDPISKHWKWCIYLGWKFDFYDPCRAMIATRFTIHRR